MLCHCLCCTNSIAVETVTLFKSLAIHIIVLWTTKNDEYLEQRLPSLQNVTVPTSC